MVKTVAKAISAHRPTVLDIPKRSESGQIRLNYREIREILFKTVRTVLELVKTVGMVKSGPNRIYTSTRAKKDFKNILLIVEIAFAFPVSAAKCERSFSTMKRIKTDSRASLGDESVENLMRIVL